MVLAGIFLVLKVRTGATTFVRTRSIKITRHRFVFGKGIVNWYIINRPQGSGKAFWLYHDWISWIRFLYMWRGAGGSRYLLERYKESTIFSSTFKVVSYTYEINLSSGLKLCPNRHSNQWSVKIHGLIGDEGRLIIWFLVYGMLQDSLFP